MFVFHHYYYLQSKICIRFHEYAKNAQNWLENLNFIILYVYVRKRVCLQHKKIMEEVVVAIHVEMVAGVRGRDARSLPRRCMCRSV